jgi:prefoldin subunit 5
VAQRERVLDLEASNRDMQERLEAARTRMEELLKRLQFLEEQMAVEEPR